ncbi:prepilin-type N-terminal cleavage/methylation domain-containing protein [bacterium]|nr:prepilin-type N-terminal cleavage/methylation domain-containing protein [bacterium]
MKNAYAFTLIELLIVVAIIGILAAIAVPNFMNAQIRAWVSRMQADMRTIGTALEQYRLDHNRYPRQAEFETCTIAFFGLPELTTPTPYLSVYPLDVFHKAPPLHNPDGADIVHPIHYGMCTSASTYWYTWSLGPDRKDQYAALIYNPSNGIRSTGDVKRTTAHDVNTTDPQ